MKEKLVKRFYCEHCKKAAGQRAAMAKHEGGCTLNPNRTCKMCVITESEQQSMDALINAAKDGLAALETLAENCPACILAAIRQLRKAEPSHVQFSRVFDESAGEWSQNPVLDDFDYKKAVAEFLAIERDGEQFLRDVKRDYEAFCV